MEDQEKTQLNVVSFPYPRCRRQYSSLSSNSSTPTS